MYYADSSYDEPKLTKLVYHLGIAARSQEKEIKQQQVAILDLERQLQIAKEKMLNDEKETLVKILHDLSQTTNTIFNRIKEQEKMLNDEQETLIKILHDLNQTTDTIFIRIKEQKQTYGEEVPQTLKSENE